MSICRWCAHESILTEDASPLLSALQGGSTPQAQAQAQMMQQATEASRVCRQCGAQVHPVAMARRLNGSGWLWWDNPDGSVYFEVMAAHVVDGKPALRTVRWTLACESPNVSEGMGWPRGLGAWTATLHDAPGGKREAGRPWEPVGEVPGV